MKTAAEILKEYCKKNNLAYWDFYEIMGGYNSVYNWYLSGLSQYDHIHFTNAGYQLQAKLLYDAIENGVKKYESLRHK
jgi:lysophospholipase L1-like esterase